MAFLEIDGILNGRRLRRCSPTGHWRYGYYLLLTNGYGRMEMDFESISYKLVSFRGTAPTPQEIETEFGEYSDNHLIFVYEHNGRKWAQFDTPNAGSKEWKTAADLKSPMPPENEYCQWLTEHHGDQWKKFHWFNPAHKTKGVRQAPAWALPSLDQDLTKSRPSPDQGSALGLGLVSGLGINTKARSKPSARKARRATGTPNSTQVAKTTGDPRHSRSQQIVMGWYQEWAGVECPWGPSEAGNLGKILKDWPGATDEQFVRCLENLARSDCIPRGTRPCEWLCKIPKFLNGPLDQFWKAKGTGNGNGTRQTSKANDREQRVIDRARRFSGSDPTGEADCAGADQVASPGNGGSGVSGLAREPEIIAPGKDSGSIRSPDDRSTKAAAR